jgi:TolA-binding protein
MRTLRLIGTVQCLALSLALASHSQTAFAQEKPGQNQAAIRIFNATAALQNSGFHERAATKWQDFLTKYPTDERIDRVTYYLGVCQLHLIEMALGQQ